MSQLRNIQLILNNIYRTNANEINQIAAIKSGADGIELF